MSYYNQPPPGGYQPPYQGGPPGPPQQGYGQPPNPYPDSRSPYPPQQQGWNQPPMQHQQHPPPQQQGWGAAPPPQQYPPHQYGPAPGQPPYGAPQGYPPQQQYGAPPPNQYGAPPGQPPYGAPPPQQQWGAPPPGQYGGPPVQPSPPSLGYGPQQTAPMDVTREVEGLRKAMKGLGTNEKDLIRILSKLDPIQANTVRAQFNQRFLRDLIKDLEDETSGDFRKGLLAIARGPLAGDAWALNGAMKGLGTKEAVLNDVLVGRSNADINAIKAEYQTLFGKPLDADLRGDLSAGTEQMFLMITAARRNEESVPVIPQQIEQEVTDLQHAIGNLVSKDAVHASQILTSKSDAQIRALADAYQRRFHKDLASVIDSKFSGHMKDALLLLVARARNRAASDAEQLEAAMSGFGTKDELLVQRVVRCHWNRQHMQQVRAEFQKKYHTDLVHRIKSETRGDYERLMVACVE